MADIDMDLSGTEASSGTGGWRALEKGWYRLMVVGTRVKRDAEAGKLGGSKALEIPSHDGVGGKGKDAVTLKIDRTQVWFSCVFP